MEPWALIRFTEQFVQQILDSVDIVELIGQYVALKPKGREHFILKSVPILHIGAN